MIIEYDSYSTSVSGIFTQHIYVYVLYECRVDVNILKVSMVKVLPLCRFPQNIRNRPILNIHKKMWEGVQLFIEIDCNPLHPSNFPRYEWRATIVRLRDDRFGPLDPSPTPCILRCDSRATI